MKFYHLQWTRIDDRVAGTDYETSDDIEVGDAMSCPDCGGHIGLLTWLPPFRVLLRYWGNEHGDLAFGVGTDILISARFRELYTKAKLTGLSLLGPADILKVVPKRMAAGAPEYTVARVLHSGAAIDFELSEFEREPGTVCQTCRLGAIVKRWSGIHIIPDTWQGEDVFVARGLSGCIVTSRRFYDFCQEHEFTNVNLVPADSYAHDFFPWEH